MTFFKTAFFAVASLTCFAACTDDVVFDEITEPETVQVENNAYSKSRQMEPRCIAAGRGSTSRPTR